MLIGHDAKGTLTIVNRLLLLCIVLAACEPADASYLAIDPLPPPLTESDGIPVRLSAIGGSGVRLEVTKGTYDGAPTSSCVVVGGPASEQGPTRAGSAIVVIHPDDVEAIVIGRLYASCSAAENPSSEVLASTALVVHVQKANAPVDAGVSGPDGGAS